MICVVQRRGLIQELWDERQIAEHGIPSEEKGQGDYMWNHVLKGQ